MRKCQLEVGTEETREHKLTLGQDCMLKVDGLGVEDLLAAEGQKLSCDGEGSFGGALKLFQARRFLSP
jgi:hypothetical protein